MERKKRELREKIIKVAGELFEHQGFNNTTMEQIAESADVARKTLYNYFPVKEAIADEYVRGISSSLAQETMEKLSELPDTRSRLLAALNKTYGWVEINPEITAVVLAYRFKTIYQEGSDSEKTGTQSLMAEIISQGQCSGEVKLDISPNLIATYIDLLRGNMAWEWVNNPGRSDIHKEIARLVDMLLYGISVEGKKSSQEKYDEMERC